MSTTASAPRVSRSLAMPALFGGAALMNAVIAAPSAVVTIAAADSLNARWAAMPNTAAVAGTGAGALVLTGLMTRRSRRAGLLLGYLAALLGAGVAALGVAGREIVLVGAGMLLIGLGNAGAQLSRYLAADLYPPARRGFAIGTVTWAAALGATGAPLLIAPTARLASGLGWAPLIGPMLFAAAAAGLAVLAASRAPAGATHALRPRVRPTDLVRTPTTRAAFAVMATAQAVMAAVMTATPLEMHMHGQGLGSVGATLSVHTLGMFALSPVTGRLVDRWGSRPVMLAGLATLGVAATLAATSGHQSTSRTAAMFLLGYGWNLSFIGGSGTLARDLPAARAAQIEGAVDAAVWGIAAAASLASTAVLSAGGYPLLAGAAGALVAIPAALLTLDNRGLRDHPALRGDGDLGIPHDAPLPCGAGPTSPVSRP
jgi:MFS family permease